MNTTAGAIFTSWPVDGRVIALLLFTGLLYVRGRGSRARLLCFLGGLTALFVALESPLDAFDALSLTAHMAQHLLLMMIAPPLILLGRPFVPLLRGLPAGFVKHGLGPFLRWPALSRVLRYIARPHVAWLAFAASTIVWHFPRFYELALRDPFWHAAQHACFFWTGMLFWWPVIEVDHRPTAWPRWTMLPYLLLADIVNTALSAFLIFSDRVLYPSYQVVRLSEWSALQDQAAAGVIMWVPGSIVYIVPAFIIAVRLFSGSSVHARRTPATQRGRPVKTGARWRVNPSTLRRVLQVAMLFVAIIVMRDGFFGSPIAALNLAGVVPWIHWRALSLLALLVAGNLFCMMCPITLTRDIARLVLPVNMRWPRWARSKWLPAALLLIYLWAYEAYSLWDRPLLTACIIAGYFITAIAIDGVFRGASFCKYVCPIGQFQFLGSLLSPAEIRVRNQDVCHTCRTYDCIRGNQNARGCELQLFQPRKHGNMDCTFCLDCVSACPQHNVALLSSTPAKILIDDPPQSSLGTLSKRTDVAVLAAVSVFGAFANAAGMVSPVMMLEHRLHALFGPGSMPAIVAAFVLAGTVLLPSLAIALCTFSNRLLRLPIAYADLVRRFVLALIPLGFAMWAAHALYHVVTSRGKVAEWLLPMQLVLLDAGLLMALYISWRIASTYGAQSKRAGAILVPWAALAAVLYVVGIWILFQPMQMRGAMP